MTKVTLTIETDKGEDPRQALARFLGIDPDKVGSAPYNAPVPATGPVAANGSAVDWTPEDFTGFWNGLTIDAKKILAEIAKTPTGCLRIEIEKALGWSGLHLAGRLSSVGHQLNRYPRRPRVWDWNQITGGYTLNPRLADWVTRLAAGQTVA